MDDTSKSPPGRGLIRSAGAVVAGRPTKGFQRTASALRILLPHLLRLLPLLDGNVGTTVSNLLSPPPPPPAPPVDLKPLEKGLAGLQMEHRNLRAQVSDQHASIERVESRLELVEDASARNTLEQQELHQELKAVAHRVEELKVAGHKANVFAMVALALLGLSVLLNVILVLYLRRVLP